MAAPTIDLGSENLNAVVPREGILIERQTRVIHGAKPHARGVTMLRAEAHGHKRRVLVRTATSSAGERFFRAARWLIRGGPELPTFSLNGSLAPPRKHV